VDALSPDDARGRLEALGFGGDELELLLDHFLDADRRGKEGHGTARIPWLERQALDPAARPSRRVEEPGYEIWAGDGALGYLTLGAICASVTDRPPARARIVVAEQCFPTGVLGYWVRRVAEAGLVAILTATSPRRLAHPDGGPPLTGTNPLAIGIPSSEGEPLVVDVSMGAVTHGDVLVGRAHEDELVPFGGEQAHKAFALALGLQLWVEALAGEEPGAVLVVARPEHDPVPALRVLAEGLRLPGDGA
jgi:LDH2 family malate/lactate/ureidoglycolate dehydrogenase